VGDAEFKVFEDGLAQWNSSEVYRFMFSSINLNLKCSVGPVQEKVPQLTGFWLFTLLPQLPICFFFILSTPISITTASAAGSIQVKPHFPTNCIKVCFCCSRKGRECSQPRAKLNCFLTRGVSLCVSVSVCVQLPKPYTLDPEPCVRAAP